MVDWWAAVAAVGQGDPFVGWIQLSIYRKHHQQHRMQSMSTEPPRRLKYSSRTLALVVSAITACIASYLRGHQDGHDEAIRLHVNSAVSAAMTDPRWRHLAADANHLSNIRILPDSEGGNIIFVADVLNSEGDVVGSSTGTLGTFAADSTVQVDYDEGGKQEFTPRYFAESTGRTEWRQTKQ